MPLKICAFFIFFFVLLPWGWLRRALGLSPFSAGARGLSGWDIKPRPPASHVTDLSRRQPQRP